jgi:hypothetical protein
MAAIQAERAKKMARKCGLAGLQKSKGLQEQQFQVHFSTRNGRNLTISGIKTPGNRGKSPLSCRRKNPIEGENPQKSRFRGFACPTAPRAFAGDLFLAKDFHRIIFRERRFGTFSLKIDIVPAFGACEHDSVCVAHTSG